MKDVVTMLVAALLVGLCAAAIEFTHLVESASSTPVLEPAE